MLKHLEEYHHYVELTGFRGVRVQAAETFVDRLRRDLPADVEVQVFDASLVATWEHLYFAVLNALMAFQTGRNLSKSVAVEAMLYASAQRQIKKAIELIGVKGNTNDVAVVVVSQTPEPVEAGLAAASKFMGKEPDEPVLDLSEKKIRHIKQAFGISDMELETVAVNGNVERALVNLVVEQVALLSTQL